METGKWKKAAIIEGVLIAAIVIFAAGFLIGRGIGTSKKAENNNSTVNDSNMEWNDGNSTGSDSSRTDGSRSDDMKETIKTDNTSVEVTETDAGNIRQQEEIIADESGLELSFQFGQSWENGEEHFYNCSMIVVNNGNEKFSDWAVRLPVAEDFKLDSFWSAEFEVTDGYMYITPAEYNRFIEPGAKIEGVGFIFSCNGEISFEDAVIGWRAENSKESNDPTTESRQSGGTAVNTYQGKLSVNGTNLVDKDNNIVQLRGISTHGIAWYPDYVNYESFKTLRDEFGINAIRLAMYTGEDGGYCTGGNQEELKKIIEEGVEYASELSMYVIIDWHILSDGNPNTNKEAAKAFFAEMSEKYASYDNVFYEICNEPNGGTTWKDVKKYAEEIIPVIRKNDKDGIILVGTPTWSQDVDKAAADPITGYDNIMYVLHFYAATHKDALRDKMVKAIDGGLPVFISEFSICDASGNGSIDYDSADKWLEVIQRYHISYIGWNLSNKNESSAILKNSCSKTHAYTEEDLSDTGKWLIKSFQ